MAREIIRDLGKFSIFQGLKDKDLAKFEDLLELKTFEADRIIIRENAEGSFIFLLLEGEVEISQALTLSMDNSEDGPDTREKAFIKLDAGMAPFMGEMSLFDQSQKRSATIIALSRCRIAVLSNENLLRVCAETPHIGYIVMRNIAAKLTGDLKLANQNILKLTTALNFVLE